MVMFAGIELLFNTFMKLARLEENGAKNTTIDKGELEGEECHHPRREAAAVSRNECPK